MPKHIGYSRTLLTKRQTENMGYPTDKRTLIVRPGHLIDKVLVRPTKLRGAYGDKLWEVIAWSSVLLKMRQKGATHEEIQQFVVAELARELRGR